MRGLHWISAFLGLWIGWFALAAVDSKKCEVKKLEPIARSPHYILHAVKIDCKK